ncbi:CAP domain-containing protein [Patescibacteria group bacterium]|nr:MAG: CAP domain-containing protein [Patescibacteria group bacterium]
MKKPKNKKPTKRAISQTSTKRPVKARRATAKTAPKRTKQTLSRLVLPSKRNDHRPLLIRARATMILTVLVLLLQLTHNIVIAGKFQVLGYASNISVGGVISQINSNRTANGLAPLATDGRLNSSAVAKAAHMAQYDYWAHTAPDGTQPWHFVTSAGYAYVRSGENLAKGFQTSAGVVNAWMASAGHKANILGAYDDVGVAVLNTTLQGEQTTLVVAHFGKPAGAPAPPNPTPAPAQPAPQPQPAPTPAPHVEQQPAPTTPPETTEPSSGQKDADEGEKATGDSPETGGAAGVDSGGANMPPPTLSTADKLKVILMSDPIQAAALVGLLLIAVISVVSHQAAWRKHKKKHGKFKFHWPLHLYHGGHLLFVMAGIVVVLAYVGLGAIL